MSTVTSLARRRYSDRKYRSRCHSDGAHRTYATRRIAARHPELVVVDDKTLSGYERAWQRAARASLSLERYVDGLSCAYTRR